VIGVAGRTACGQDAPLGAQADQTPRLIRTWLSQPSSAMVSSQRARISTGHPHLPKHSFGIVQALHRLEKYAFARGTNPRWRTFLAYGLPKAPALATEWAALRSTCSRSSRGSTEHRDHTCLDCRSVRPRLLTTRRVCLSSTTRNYPLYLNYPETRNGRRGARHWSWCRPACSPPP
jgi:hypothetical protein